MFKNGGIYVLDDPMSAIDPCLRLRIFDQVIGNKGLLRRKTRIIITKDPRFLRKFDYIIVMKNQVCALLSLIICIIISNIIKTRSPKKEYYTVKGTVHLH